MALKRLQSAASPDLKKLLAIGEDGNTLLHHAAMQQQTNGRLEEHIDTLGEEAAVVLAKMSNNKGDIPIELARKPLPDPLLRLTIKHNVKPLHEKCDEKEILALSSNKPVSKRLYENLLIGCAVVNMVRDLKLESNTHPSYLDKSIDERHAVDHKIGRMRMHCQGGVGSHDMLYEYLTNEIVPPTIYGVANCYEFSMLSLFALISEFNKLDAGVYSVVKGDHAVAVIDPTTLEDAVVCDAHNGVAYAARDIPERMIGFSAGFAYSETEGVSRTWMSHTSYNPNIHGMKLRFSLQNKL